MTIWPRLRSERTQRALIWVILPLAVYTLAAVIVTWPLAERLTTHAAGTGYSDSYEVIRHGWWTREALLHLDNPFDQPLLVYPEGFSSRVQLAQPIQYFAVGIPALVFSPLTAFNLAVIGTLVLNGTAAYWLGMNLNGRRALAALLGGLIFLAYPKMQGHLGVGHLSILSLYPLPLFVICMWRVLREGAAWRTVIAGGVCFALTVLASVSMITYVLMPLLVFWALYSILWDRHHIITRGLPLNQQHWFKGIVMLVFGGALILPFYVPLFTAEGRAEVSDIEAGGRVRYSTDLLAFASPSPFGLLKKADLVPDYVYDVLGTNSTEGTAYLGVTAVLLAALAVIRREAARLWLVIALGAMILSLGTLLKWRDDVVTYQIEDYKSYVTLPWALFQELPVLDSTRTPGRFNLTTGLALSAMVSLGAAIFFTWVRWRGVRIVLAVILAAAVIVEYQLFWPFDTVNATQPDYFRELAKTDDVRAVLDVPVNHYQIAKLALYQQTFHHKPLIAGYAARRTIQDPALLNVLDRAIAPSEDMLPLPPGALPYLLSVVGADRLIVHKEGYKDPGGVVDRLNAILGAPEFEDSQIAAYAVPRTDDPPPDFVLAGAASGEDWLGPLDDTNQSFLTTSGEWYFYAAQETYGDLVYPASPYGPQRQIGVWLDDHLIAGEWLAVDSAFRVKLWLTPGFHTLRLESMNGCTDYPFPPICITSSQLENNCEPLEMPVCISAAFGVPTWTPVESFPTPLDVRLDGGLRLRAYEMQLNQEDHTLAVRLFWSAEEALPENYALFVHLADSDTGEPLAQANGFPALTTDTWEEDTRWQSEAVITLPDDLPAGTYDINVGWFDPSANTRLGVHGDRKWAAQGIVNLGPVEIEAKPESPKP
jgi:hypothetical protein